MQYVENAHTAPFGLVFVQFVAAELSIPNMYLTQGEDDEWALCVACAMGHTHCFVLFCLGWKKWVMNY